jgi:cytochrome c
MRLLRFLEPRFRGARCKTGDPPAPNASRERGPSTRPRSVAHAERRDEWSTDAAVRRREKYAAAVTLAAAISVVLAETASAGGLTGDAARGETLYEACQDCHSLDKNDVGPRHRGVFGRKAASLPDYDYSNALKSANIVWNEETLDKWLTDPQAVAPGAKMFFHLDNPQDRADVIAYLKERAK